MPDKIYNCRKTKDCPRCWRNRLLHACPSTKSWLKKHPEFVKQMDNEKRQLWCAWGGNYYQKVSTSRKDRRAKRQEEIDNPKIME
jgi:hypothetical protein